MGKCWCLQDANRPAVFGGCDIYITYLTDNGWSEGVNLGDRSTRINGNRNLVCLRINKSLYFASRRFGGQGGSRYFMYRICSPMANGDSLKTLERRSTASVMKVHPLSMPMPNSLFHFRFMPGYGGTMLLSKEKSRWDLERTGKSWLPDQYISDGNRLDSKCGWETGYYSSDKSDSRGGQDL